MEGSLQLCLNFHHKWQMVCKKQSITADFVSVTNDCFCIGSVVIMS